MTGYGSVGSIAGGKMVLEIAGKATYIFFANRKFIFKLLVEAGWGHPARFLQIRNNNIQK